MGLFSQLSQPQKDALLPEIPLPRSLHRYQHKSACACNFAARALYKPSFQHQTHDLISILLLNTINRISLFFVADDVT